MVMGRVWVCMILFYSQIHYRHMVVLKLYKNYDFSLYYESIKSELKKKDLEMSVGVMKD
jgi:hypothetical protein